MPTYEYRCPEGHAFDVFQKMSAEPVASCPECGKPGERQISTGAGFLFKGKGFYITDYRSKDYKEKAKSDRPGGEGKEKSKGSDGGNGGGSGGGSSSGGESSSSGSSSSGPSSGGSGASKGDD